MSRQTKKYMVKAINGLYYGIQQFELLQCIVHGYENSWFNHNHLSTPEKQYDYGTR